MNDAQLRRLLFGRPTRIAYLKLSPSAKLRLVRVAKNSIEKADRDSYTRSRREAADVVEDELRALGTLNDAAIERVVNQVRNPTTRRRAEGR